MKRFVAILLCVFLFLGCSTSDYQSLLRAAASQNPTAVLKGFATHKSIQYATNPNILTNDLKSIDKNFFGVLTKFLEAVTNNWGEENVKIPSKKEYVKYMQNYKSRALVDFDAGIVTVETIDSKSPKESLKNAIVTTLLLPDDPRSADLFGSKAIKLGETPYLLGEVQDDQHKNIRYMWRANRYADVLLKNDYQTKTLKNNGNDEVVHFVRITMLKDHGDVRVAKFKPYVQKYAHKFGVSENLIYAIIKTESNFNQFALSHAGALGLMQIVPSSAGKDAYKEVKGKNWTPSKEYLFDAQNNIELGAAYLSILEKKYLKGITNSISREYCIISAYNTGSGNVLNTFHFDRSKAKNIINAKTPAVIYKELRSNLPYEETRRYLQKVVNYKKDFVNL